MIIGIRSSMFGAPGSQYLEAYKGLEYGEFGEGDRVSLCGLGSMFGAPPLKIRRASPAIIIGRPHLKPWQVRERRKVCGTYIG